MIRLRPGYGEESGFARASKAEELMTPFYLLHFTLKRLSTVNVAAFKIFLFRGVPINLVK